MCAAEGGVCRDALRTCDVYEGVVAGRVSFHGDRVDRLQFLGGVDKALVTARNVIVHLDPEDVGVGGLADDLSRIIETQAVTGDTHVMRPVLVCLASQEAGQAKEYGESLQHGVNLPEDDFLASPGTRYHSVRNKYAGNLTRKATLGSNRTPARRAYLSFGRSWTGAAIAIWSQIVYLPRADVGALAFPYRRA